MVNKILDLRRASVTILWNSIVRLIQFMRSTVELEERTNEGLNRKSLKLADDEQLDKALYAWFIQQRSSGTPISGPLLQEKAKHFSTQLNTEAADREFFVYISISLIFIFSIIRTLNYPDYLSRSRRVWIIEVRLYTGLFRVSPLCPRVSCVATLWNESYGEVWPLII